MKALKLLKVIGKEDLFKDFINKNNGNLTKFINEGIEELEALENVNNDFELLKKENTRLKKQLSKDHHMECSCSFCKPVEEKQSCENCRHYYGTQTCNKFVARSSYNYKSFCCNKWELKC